MTRLDPSPSDFCGGCAHVCVLYLRSMYAWVDACGFAPHCSVLTALIWLTAWSSFQPRSSRPARSKYLLKTLICLDTTEGNQLSPKEMVNCLSHSMPASLSAGCLPARNNTYQHFHRLSLMLTVWQVVTWRIYCNRQRNDTIFFFKSFCEHFKQSPLILCSWYLFVYCRFTVKPINTSMLPECTAIKVIWNEEFTI